MTPRNLRSFNSLIGATVATRRDRVLQAHRVADQLDGMMALAFAEGDVQTLPRGLDSTQIAAWLSKKRVRLVIHVSPAFEAVVRQKADAAGMAEGDWLEDRLGLYEEGFNDH